MVTVVLYRYLFIFNTAELKKENGVEFCEHIDAILENSGRYLNDRFF